MIDKNADVLVVDSDSPLRTEALGRSLGGALRAGDVLALDGDLGAGKTVLVRGLATGAGADPLIVRSPTFVLHHVYRGTRLTLHHIDCYRLGEYANLDSLDVDSLVEDGALAVEWAAYAPQLEELSAVHVHIEVVGDAQRRITIRSLPPRLRAALEAAG